MHKTNTNKDIPEPIAVDIGKLSAMLGCGQQTARKIAEEAHAVIHLNRRTLFSVEKIKKYINLMAE